MTDQLRRTWRHLTFRAKLLLALLALCSAAITGALALDDAYIPWGDSRHIGTNDNIIDSNFPSWFGSAFKTGSGVWDTNIPAWYVSPDDSNEAALGVLFSRSMLTNSLIMKLGYLDSSNSSLFLDMLLMTNQSVVVTNLFNNILTGSGLGTSRIFNVSLADTNAIGLQFRRGIGSITIYDTLLSPDGDGDGFSDMEETIWGSDPNSALSIPCAAITGQVFYAGVQSGVIHVLAATNANDWASAYYLTMSLPPASHVAPFTLPGLPLRRPYYARAWRDVNDNQTKDYWEPFGTAVPVSLYLGSNTGNVVIVMSDPDSDGDGMSDADELMLGMDPLTSNTYARLPFIEGFETNTVHVGDINNQNHWLATPLGAACVQTNTVYEGVQAMLIKSGVTQANVRQLFAVSNAPVVWLDARVQALSCSVPTNAATGSAVMFIDGNGFLKAYDGLNVSSNKWMTLTNVPSCGTTGAWVRLTTKLDYSAQRWLVCVNGVLAGEGLGFATPVSQFTMVSFVGGQSGVDSLSISTNKPTGLSLDGDRLPDDWELAQFGNLDQTDTGDADSDGVNNQAEFLRGTSPVNPDTDNDGIPDGWELAHGLNPTNATDAALDSDGDGLSNVGEYVAGTDPRNAASHCWSITGKVAYTGPQTGLIWVAACSSPTGFPVAGQVINVGTGGYVIADLPPNSNYWVRAWRDTDGNGSNDFWEAQGVFTNNPVVLHTNVSGINITLSDPDSDGDGMPDWWELAHGFNPTNALDALQDTDGDGLNNLAEYQHKTDPRLGDSDHDGINDGPEVGMGSDPRVANTCTQLPFIEGFETNTVMLGELNGQNHWSATPLGASLVQTNKVYEGVQALMIKSDDTPANVCQLFAVSNAPVVWLDVHVQALERSIPTNAATGSAIMFFDANGYLKVYDGLNVSSNKWVTLTNVPSCGTTGSWVRLTTKLDYSTQRWLVCVDGILAAEGLGFAMPVSQFTMVSFVGGASGVDAFAVSTNEPAGLSLDGDLMPDDWEMAQFGNLVQVDSGDPDQDAASNLEEYRRGTNPNAADSDNDGIPDGWEITHGLNPTNAADATLDPDGDGLANLAEYQYGSQPLVSDTDHDGLSDGVEVNTWHSCPLSMDSDGDGYKDADEVARGTDLTDPESHPASHWGNHLKLMFRSGSLTNRLTDVPVLVRLTPERIDYSQCAADGRDILFTDAAGSPLAFELERWKPGGESLFWVRLPEAGGTNSADHFWIHWNYPEATNAANAAGVWSTNYLGVWHLAETNTVLADSTPGTYAATNVGAVCVTGILGNARNFRGSDSVIVPPAALATISNAVSISFWQYGATNQPFNDACFEGTGAAGRELNAHVPWSDGNVYWDAFGNYDRINKLATTNLYKGGWNYWVFTKDRAAGTMRIYVNGELWHSGTGKTRAYTSVTAFRFGSAANGSSGYVGMMDEFRVESLAQTPEWVRFQYKAMLDQVLIYGEQQVSIAGTGNGAEPSQAGEFTVTRTIQNTNFALLVNLTVSGGTATEGADFTTLPRSVLIPSGATQATFPVPVIDDLWLEGAETVTVAIAQGNYFINATNASASIAIMDDDVDSDADGMCDAWEMLKFGNLDATATGDADNDGGNNLQEYLHGTNPHTGDTDQDGLPDQWEIAMGTDPLTADADADPDKDGLTNMQEYQLGTNPRSADTDGDGMPDKWEVDHGLNPLVNDAALDPDNDGLTNLQEYQNGTDPHNPDTDGDGLTDSQEVKTNHTNPLNPDTDGDGMPDKWEVDNGTNPLVNDAQADPDSDLLTNTKEFVAGTKPLIADTDVDGVNDGIELLMAFTDPLVADFNGQSVILFDANATSATNRIGTWQDSGPALVGLSGSGSLDFSLVAPSAGVFAVEFEIAQYVVTGSNPGRFDLSLRYDGLEAGRQTAVVQGSQSVVTKFFLPRVQAGEILAKLVWNADPAQGGSLVVRRVRLVSFGGIDADQDGVLDWEETRLAHLRGVALTGTNSVVSPVCFEGTSADANLLTLYAEGVPVEVRHAIGAAWYANVPLSPTDDTVIATSVVGESGAVTNIVRWTALNLLDAPTNALLIRAGSDLKMDARPDSQSNGVVHVEVVGITNYITTVGTPVIHSFGPGAYTVRAAFSNDVLTTNSEIQVRAIGAAFPYPPACLLGKSRTWTCSNVVAEVTVQADPRLAFSFSRPTSNTVSATFTSSTLASQYLTYRLGADGPILDAIPVQTLSLLSTDSRSLDVLQTFDDGRELVAVTVVLSDVPTDADIRFYIFGGGVTLDDGTLLRYLTASDFSDSGQYTYYLIRSADSLATFCHTTTLYQGEQPVAPAW